MRRVVVEAPASSANLGPGFDVFALALASPTDRVRLGAEGASRFSLKVRQTGGAPVPLSSAKNGAGAVCMAMAIDHRVHASVVMEITKGVPIGLGMGSSGASAAAAALAMNELFGLGLNGDELIYYAGKGEEVASGSPHYDNVSASVLGGFVVVRSGERPSAIRFDAPASMALCVATPVVTLPGRKTEYARSILPKAVELKKVVANVANASTIVSGFALGKIDMIGKGMTDVIVEEARKQLIPGYDLVKEEALLQGASGVCISGAGPSMLAVVDKKRTSQSKVLKAMISAFRDAGVKSSGFATKVGEGARTIEDS